MRHLPVVGLLLLAAPVLASDWSLEALLKNDPKWKGFGVGTMVHMRTTTEMTMPQMPTGGRKTVKEQKETLVKVTDEAYVVKAESKSADGKWEPLDESTIPKEKKSSAKVEDLGEGEVTVGGEKLACKRKKVTRTEGGDVVTMVAFVHDKHGVVRIELDQGGAIQATKLSLQRKVGDMTLECREYALSGSGAKGRMILCLQVPDMTVYHELGRSQDGASYKQGMELVAFTKK